jgi:nucleoid-associated protein YgaU
MCKLKRQHPRIKRFVFISALALTLAGPAWPQFSVLPEEETQPRDGEPFWGEAAPERVTVQPGETLSEIAERVYGNPGQWRLIYEANRDRLQDPDHVPAGIELMIPAP